MSVVPSGSAHAESEQLDLTTQAPCRCSYWRSIAIDALLELAHAKERLARIDEDVVELVGAKRFEFYRKLGGTILTEGAFRAKVRHELLTGEHL